MPQWIEISLRVDGEAAEAVAQELHKFCTQGVAVEQDGIMPNAWDDGEVPPPEYLIVRGYFPDDDNAEHTRQQINQVLRYLNMMYPVGEPVYKQVKDEDWAEAWKAHYKPVRIGQRMLIRPRWIEVETAANDVLISLDPGMAFGTGTHPTTQLCLEALEETVKPGVQVLDLGCGSGILSIAALKLGAAHVLALDIDPIAVDVTAENATDNGVADRVTAQTGSLESVVSSSRRFDLIVVNILAKVIIPMCDNHLGETVRPGGIGIFSGLIDEQADDVEAALRRTGLVPQRRYTQGDWVAIVAQRPASV